MENVKEIAKNAHNAFLKTMSLSNVIKNSALNSIIKFLELNREKLLEANKKDLENAIVLVDENKITKATYDRLKLTDLKINDLIEGLKDLIKLDDPVNQILWQKELDKNLILKKVSCPIGLIGVIFEARPDCFVQIASLIIKSGNCAILKGGKECFETNTLMNKIINEALNEIKEFPKNVINLIHSHDDVNELLALDEYVNLIIPRGSNKLVKFIKENTKIPVLGHASGICHIFVDKDYDIDNALKIIIDAKTQYPSACNSVETILIHKDFQFISELKEKLIDADIKIIENPDDFSKEYSDKILSFKIVENIDKAIEHINKYGSGHTDSILSNDKKNIEKFMNFVDSSSVFANCSTRFSDGFRYGFGAEVGISTNKTHARGPVGLDGLTIYKYKLYGSNDIVYDYATGNKKFSHKIIQ